VLVAGDGTRGDGVGPAQPATSAATSRVAGIGWRHIAAS
jgi:hypothetical protein